MFTKLREKQALKFEEELAWLQRTCDEYPDIAEFVKYIVAYGSEDDTYSGGGSYEATLGRAIIQHVWEISKLDLSCMGNSYHFNLSWVTTLNSFIGNYFLDDAAFKLKPFDGYFEFMASEPDDAGEQWLQDPRVIIEAAKANRAYWDIYDEMGPREAHRAKIKVDRTKVMELILENGG